MITSAAVLLVESLLVATLAAGGIQESTGPAHAGYDPSIAYEHDHSGPLGEKLLRIEESLRCNCGCGLDVHICQFQMQCGVSPVWSQRILDRLGAGESEEVILAGFVADYGTTALMAPPMKGFNWLGYLLPGSAILLAGALVGLALRRNVSAPRPATAGPEPTDDDWSRLQEAIRDIEREGVDEW